MGSVRRQRALWASGKEAMRALLCSALHRRTCCGSWSRQGPMLAARRGAPRACGEGRRAERSTECGDASSSTCARMHEAPRLPAQTTALFPTAPSKTRTAAWSGVPAGTSISCCTIWRAVGRSAGFCEVQRSIRSSTACGHSCRCDEDTHNDRGGAMRGGRGERQAAEACRGAAAGAATTHTPPPCAPLHAPRARAGCASCPAAGCRPSRSGDSEGEGVWREGVEAAQPAAAGTIPCGPLVCSPPDPSGPPTTGFLRAHLPQYDAH